MSKVFKFQDPGEGIHEGEVLRVLVSPNDEVQEGQDVFEVETDKASFDLSCPYDGVVEELHVQEGDQIKVGDPLMTIGDNAGASKKGESKEDQGDRKTSEEEESSEDRDKDVAQEGEEPSDDQGRGNRDEESAAESEEEKTRKATEEKEKKKSVRSSEEKKPEGKEKDRRKEQKQQPAKSSATQKESQEKKASSPQKGPVPASPATRRVARELNVDLQDVTPSGEEGRVLTGDVRAFAEFQEAQGRAKEGKGREEEGKKATPGFATDVPSLPDFAQWGPVERKPLRSIRRETAKRMALSWSQIPHVTHNDVADISELEKFRQRHAGDIEAKGGKLTLTVLVMKAVVGALHEFPGFNASLDLEAEEIVLKSYYHIGVALDSERGLLVPVIRDVDRKSVSELAVELFELAERVRKGKVRRQEMGGASFTITNPGPLGGTSFTPIINFPEVAILGLGHACLQPVVHGTMENPDIRARFMLPLSLAFDHRVNDGALAARFVNRIIQVLTDIETFALMV